VSGELVTDRGGLSSMCLVLGVQREADPLYVPRDSASTRGGRSFFRFMFWPARSIVGRFA
jgi:hypothetical protein